MKSIVYCLFAYLFSPVMKTNIMFLYKRRNTNVNNLLKAKLVTISFLELNVIQSRFGYGVFPIFYKPNLKPATSSKF